MKLELNHHSPFTSVHGTIFLKSKKYFFQGYLGSFHNFALHEDLKALNNSVTEFVGNHSAKDKRWRAKDFIEIF